jgi:hypothetical protein
MDGRGYLGDISVNESIILKRISDKYCVDFIRLVQDIDQ